MAGKDFLTLVSMFIVIFFLFSVAGWCMEVTLKFIQYRRFINRGFLIGPYCPIYGWGAVAVTLIVGGLLARRGTIGETFLAGMVVCGALEYFTSWYMEKMFHARWWDYSTKPMNLHGRIWIGNLLLFGAASVVIVKGIVPFLLRWLGKIPALTVEIAAGCIVVLMLADNAVSHYLMNVVKQQIDTQEGDSTEEISRKVRELLKTKGVLLRRIQAAYPTAQARSRRLVENWKQAKNKLKAAEAQLRQEQTAAAEAAKDKLKAAGTQLRQEQTAAAEAAKDKLKAAAAKSEEKRRVRQEQAEEARKARLQQAEARWNAAKQELKSAERKLFGEKD